MSDNDDVKERMRLALEAKNSKAAKGGTKSGAKGDAKGQGSTDRAGGKREFRRKSGG